MKGEPRDDSHFDPEAGFHGRRRTDRLWRTDGQRRGLYLAGRLDLDSLVSRCDPLADFETLTEDMESGRIARAVLMMDSTFVG